MFNTLYLQWFYAGCWSRIGFAGHTPKRADDLTEHAKNLSKCFTNESYRLVTESALLNGPLNVVETFGPSR